MPRLLNRRFDDYPDAVYIGRPSYWGNPFIMGKDGNRTEVIAKHKEWFLSNPEMVKRCIEELKGKDLCCWCDPLPCHGRIYLEVANQDWTQLIL
jgi:hypothetical protein